MSEARTRSNWLYLLPIGLGVIGGIIAYLVLRKEDYDKARDCVIWGIVINTVALVAYTDSFNIYMIISLIVMRIRN